MQTSFTHSITTAQTAHDQDKLVVWVLEYLRGEGKNDSLANSIQKRPHATTIFKEYPIENLKRIMGPEPDMQWQEDPQTWEQRVKAITQAIEAGAQLPPLIVTDFWDNELHLSDGNHRHEALLRLGITHYWTIFFVEDKSVRYLCPEANRPKVVAGVIQETSRCPCVFQENALYPLIL